MNILTGWFQESKWRQYLRSVAPKNKVLLRMFFCVQKELITKGISIYGGKSFSRKAVDYLAAN
jgi:hypothetical protein